MFSLRDEILKTCFVRTDENIILAGGESANNKIEMDLLAQNSRIETLIIRGLSRRVRRHNPDFVIGVPNGATRFAVAVGEILDVPVVRLRKDEEGIRFASSEEREKLEGCTRGVLLEDVANTLSTSRKVLAVEGIGGRAVALEAIYDRRTDTRREPLHIPCDALINEYIPAQLPINSPLMEYTK